MCLHFDYRLKGNVQLDVSYQLSNGFFEKFRTCVLMSDDREEWNSTDVLFPPLHAPFRVVFDATILSAKFGGGIDIDNLMQLDENCTLTTVEGV
jgi:hypothetical protein